MGQELIRVIEQIGREKGISRETLVQAVEAAVVSASKKRFASMGNMEARLDPESGEVDLFNVKDVVEVVEDSETQISLAEARAVNPNADLGGKLVIPVQMEGLGRIAAQTAKQVIVQRVREAEREIVFNEFRGREGELVNCAVMRIERGNIIVDMGKTEGILPRREQSFREVFRRGERIRAYIVEVKKTPKGPQVILSRTHSGFLKKLFELEVPEVAEGTVEIVAGVREPSGRAKIAVRAKEKDVDPVGACVGVRGSRVQAIVQELRGEKIDIIQWTDDPVDFVKNALSPAKVSRITANPQEKAMEVIVPDDQLSLAIGKKGQNVRLAAKLSQWRIDIKSEAEHGKQEAERQKIALEKARGDLTGVQALKGVEEETIQLLMGNGFTNLTSVLEAPLERLQEIPGMDQEKALRIKELAHAFVRGETQESPGAADEREIPALTVSEDSQSQGHSLLDLEGVGEKTAHLLEEHGIATVEVLSQASEEKLTEIPGIGRARAGGLIQKAREFITGGSGGSGDEKDGGSE
ncbi:MAG: transcription termination/antitermination protein NusA [Candidatus Tectomicrobia bacterium]|uniref:Transcription termination/antitermination protein NusA n=1 Tax=Tectimicrobiota bacterium TaxID=2528274 RepID=A0A932LZJ3_UNCTE|nr:transcription termination/antitermination protein NusA [Candidatus Tectomicrobia bacterium]